MTKTMAQWVEAVFSPVIRLKYWESRDQFTADRVEQFSVFTQLRTEAHVRGVLRLRDYERFLFAASARGYSVEVIYV